MSKHRSLVILAAALTVVSAQQATAGPLSDWLKKTVPQAPSSAPAATQAQPTAVTDSAAAQTLARAAAKIDEALKAGKIEDADYPLRSLVISMNNPREKDGWTAEMRAKAYDLRKRVAEAGGNVKTYGAFWDYDGQQLSDKEKKFIDVVDQKLDITPGGGAPAPKAMQAALDDASRLLSKDEFKDVPALKAFVENFASPRLAGFVKRLNDFHVKAFAEAFREANLAVQNNVAGEALRYIGYCREHYDAVARTKVDMTKVTFEIPVDELSSRTFVMADANKELTALASQSNAIKAKLAGEQAAWEKKWNTMMKADKLALYKKLGVPENFATTMTGWQPEDAAKSSWWLYTERVSWHYYYKTTYRFDANHKLVGTEKNLIFWPH